MSRFNSSRRTFLKGLGMLGVSSTVSSTALLSTLARAQQPELTDEDICRQRFFQAKKRYLHEKPIGDVVAMTGFLFCGTPYVAQTLEAPGDEHLIVNLRGLDCVTFVESALALARCVKLQTPTFDAYKQQLQRIRYRSGVIAGYPSRLHYFSDWISDNERKGIVRNVTKSLGGKSIKKKIDFMSTHPSSYRQLSNSQFLEKIKATERELSASEQFIIPKERLASVEGNIQHGDIIAITTSVPGLDVSHTGMAFRLDGVLRYLHAPLSKGTVQMSEGSLAAYLAGKGKQTGIMVARPLEPST